MPRLAVDGPLQQTLIVYIKISGNTYCCLYFISLIFLDAKYNFAQLRLIRLIFCLVKCIESVFLETGFESLFFVNIFFISAAISIYNICCFQCASF